MELSSIKQRFGIIGHSELLNRALEVALRVAPTDLSVLVVGESGVGKEFFPQIIHAHSARKHNKYIAVNCGAIPEGTIDSELFGHEKGAFTGAVDSRRGYFEEADGGTIFLDEVGELPLATQVRLLRVLQNGEFIRVGSTKVQRCDVRVVAATNREMIGAIDDGRFREDLYYRLATVPIQVPALRERKEDINLLFRKFSSDVATRYRMPAISLDQEAKSLLENYYWRGNIRQLKNVAEQISAIEQERSINAEILSRYLPDSGAKSEMIGAQNKGESGQHANEQGGRYHSERELLYKILFDMRSEIADLRGMVAQLLPHDDYISKRPNAPTSPATPPSLPPHEDRSAIRALLTSSAHTQNESDLPLSEISSQSNSFPASHQASASFTSSSGGTSSGGTNPQTQQSDKAGGNFSRSFDSNFYDEAMVEELPREMSKSEVQREQIIRALRKHHGKRKEAAAELFISERTLYRRIKELGVDEF